MFHMSEVINWSDAQQRCEAAGLQLATIDSAEKQQQAEAILSITYPE